MRPTPGLKRRAPIVHAWAVWAWASLPWLLWAPMAQGISYVSAFVAFGALLVYQSHSTPFWASRLATQALFGTASLAVFAGAAQAPMGPGYMAWAAIAVCIGPAALPHASRAKVVWAHLLVGAVLLGVAQTLWRSGYAPQAWRFGHLGIGAGAAASMWVTRPVRATPKVRRSTAGAIGLVALVSVARTIFVGAIAQAPLLPAWREKVQALSAPGADPQEVADLLSLQAAGARDAAFVRIAQALEDNAEPEILRSMCPPWEGQGPLPAAWAKLVQRGRAVCRALHAVLPEASASWLALHAEAERDAGLCRLLADLAWEAGAPGQAETWAARATALGDPYAARNTHFAQALRNLPSHSLVPKRDASGERIWKHFNDAMHFDDHAVGSHHGLRLVDAPGRLGMLYEPSLMVQVLTQQSPYGLGTGLDLPVPGQAPMPAALRLHIRARGGVRLRVASSTGDTQMFDCETTHTTQAHADHGAARRPMPPAVCQNSWADVILPLRPGSKGATVTGITLYGDFMLASVEAVAARPAPQDQSADTGHDLTPPVDNQ